MKKFFLIAAALLFAAFTPLTAKAQAVKTLLAAVTAATPTNVLSGGKYTITEIQFLNSSTNAGSLKFYDASNNATNYVQPAYTSISQLATNWVYNFTNSSGIVITNTFTGTYALSTTVGAATNELPSLLGPLLIPVASIPVEFNGFAVAPSRGFNVYSTVPGTLMVTYKQLYP